MVFLLCFSRQQILLVFIILFVIKKFLKFRQTISIEVKALSLIILALKLCFGLDDVQEYIVSCFIILEFLLLTVSNCNFLFFFIKNKT